MLVPEFREAFLSQSSDGGLALATFDGCISGYSIPDWKELSAQILSLDPTSRKVRDMQRLIVGGGLIVIPDKLGRIQIPQRHRNYARLTKDVYIVGLGGKIEIWDMQRYDERIDSNEENVFGETNASNIDLNRTKGRLLQNGSVDSGSIKEEDLGDKSIDLNLGKE